jgi:hypothetical protein
MFNCNICKKQYASYHSLWIHNKKYHLNNTNIIIKTNTNTNNNQNTNNNDTICLHCNRVLKNKYLLQKHLSRCHIKKYNDANNIQPKRINEINHNINNDTITNTITDKNNDNSTELKLKIKLAEIEAQKIKDEKEILKLKLKLNKTKQNTNNNIKNINNQLLNNSNNTINNITNNFSIVALGKENLLETLSNYDKKEIIKSRYGCLERIVDITHCGKYDKFKNIIITNLKDDYAYKYDDKQKKFICINKNEIMTELIDERLGNIREIYEELSETNKIDNKTKTIIQDFLEQMDDTDKFIDDSGITYKNYRTYREHKVKILIYNNTDKITQDLAIVLDGSFDDNFNNQTNLINLYESIDV